MTHMPIDYAVWGAAIWGVVMFVAGWFLGVKMSREALDRALKKQGQPGDQYPGY